MIRFKKCGSIVLRVTLIFLSLTVSLQVRSEQVQSEEIAWEWPKPLKSETGNFCQDELQELLRKRYGAHVKVTYAKALKDNVSWFLWAKSNLCQGWILAQFNNETWECKRDHYFFRPRTLIAAYGFDGQCNQVIPKTIYWKWGD